MMLFEMPLLPSQKTRGFTFYTNKSMSFHLLPFSFFQYWVDIVLSVDDIYTLINVVVDPNSTKLVLCVVSSCGVVTMMDVHEKEIFYQDQHSINALFPILLYLDNSF
jgi:hypothetical protein